MKNIPLRLAQVPAIPSDLHQPSPHFPAHQQRKNMVDCCGLGGEGKACTGKGEELDSRIDGAVVIHHPTLPSIWKRCLSDLPWRIPMLLHERSHSRTME